MTEREKADISMQVFALRDAGRKAETDEYMWNRPMNSSPRVRNNAQDTAAFSKNSVFGFCGWPSVFIGSGFLSGAGIAIVERCFGRKNWLYCSGSGKMCMPLTYTHVVRWMNA